MPLMQKWGVRGVVRGATMAGCAVSCMAGGLVYAVGRKEDEEDED